MNVFALDTETFPLSPESLTPKLVCCSLAMRLDGDLRTILTGNGDSDCAQGLGDCLSPGLIMVGHNIAYDLAVICASYPDLEPAVWAKVLAGEVTDTAIRERLLNLSTSGKLEKIELPDGSSQHLKYGLADLILKYEGIDISESKEVDSWRTRFNLLDGLLADQYPPDAADYARNDAGYTLMVYEHQANRVQSEDACGSLSTEFFRTAAAFALYLMQARGMAVDPVEHARLQTYLDGELADHKLPLLIEAGILRPAQPARPYANGAKNTDGSPKMVAPTKSSKDTKILLARVQSVASSEGIPLRLTETGAVSADAEMISLLAPFDHVLAQYQHRESLQKLQNTELPRMMWEGKVANQVHFKFNCLVETGRTSSYGNSKEKEKALYPAASGQQFHKVIRPCYVARPGHVLYSCDYSTLELVTAAQTCYNLFGYSTLKDRINAGVDSHAFLGAQMAHYLSPEFRLSCGSHVSPDFIYGHFLALKTTNPTFYKHWRDLGKPTGLGLWGGLGPETFMEFGKTQYDVDLMALVEGMPDLEFDVNRGILFYAKKVHGMSEAEFRWTPKLRAIALAQKFKEIWQNTYPETVDYFNFINTNCKDPRNEVIGYRDDGRPIQGYCYTSPMGMHRAATNYTGAANGLALQTPAAEGALSAVFEVVRAHRDITLESVLYHGGHPIDFIHDELVGELLEDSMLEARQLEIQSIMKSSMARITPDVKVGTEMVLMRRWRKDAKPVFDTAGNLLVWEPQADLKAAG